MIANRETIYEADLAKKQMRVQRSFHAPLSEVWSAWTDPSIMDIWWAPKPWKTNTISMDFRPGGKWFYFMGGPDGSRHYCVVNFISVDHQREYTGKDGFCDESGNILGNMPNTLWKVHFTSDGDETTVDIELSFASEEDMNKLIEMGFRQGFAMAHQNLDELLANGSKA